MNPRLRNMLIAVGTFSLAGAGMYVFRPQPASRTMLELKDAGVLDGQRVVIICPERITRQTKRRIDANQPGLLRPSQSYARIARSARCFNPDGGNCLRPSDGLVRVGSLEAELIIPSLRRDLTGIDLDASVGSDDGGDNDDVDDALQFDVSSCTLLTCTQFDDGVTAGTYLSPYANGCLGGLNRLALQPLPCMMPNGWGRGADGGWCEESSCLSSSPAGRPCVAGDACGVVDCRGIGPYGLPDGGPRWRGFNVTPREYAVGAACVPVECGVAAGDVPAEWL